MERKSLTERKITKTISLSGNAIMKLEELASANGEKSQSNLIEKLINEHYSKTHGE